MTEAEPRHDSELRNPPNLGGVDPELPKNEPRRAGDSTPDSMTPPSAEEVERQKSYGQLRREHRATELEQREEEARLKAQFKIANGQLSIGLQPQPVPMHRGPVGIRPDQQGTVEPREGETIATHHLEDITLLPKFTVDDARKLKGGEGQQFRIDAVRMVEAETARVAQLHEIVGADDVWLGCDGIILDPVDWTSLDNALAAAQAQVEVRDDGDSDVKEIALISAALMETARYWAVEGPEQAAPPPEGGEGEGGALAQRRDLDPNLDPNLTYTQPAPDFDPVVR